MDIQIRTIQKTEVDLSLNENEATALLFVLQIVTSTQEFYKKLDDDDKDFIIKLGNALGQCRSSYGKRKTYSGIS